MKGTEIRRCDNLEMFSYPFVQATMNIVSGYKKKKKINVEKIFFNYPYHFAEEIRATIKFPAIILKLES